MGNSPEHCRNCELGLFCYDHIVHDNSQPIITRPHDKPSSISTLNRSNDNDDVPKQQQQLTTVSDTALEAVQKRAALQLPQIFVNGHKIFG